MSEVLLYQTTVLILNKSWQAINVGTPAEAFCHMMGETAHGLDIEGEDNIRPVSWREWLALPIRDHDRVVHTVRVSVRVPTVIVLSNYARIPVWRPKLSSRSIRERDGNRCQYTGELLKPSEGSIDHILPRSRGGKDSWENCVWSSKKVNSRKGSRLPEEAGLALLRKPKAVPELPVTALIRNTLGIPDWNIFMIQ